MKNAHYGGNGELAIYYLKLLEKCAFKKNAQKKNTFRKNNSTIHAFINFLVYTKLRKNTIKNENTHLTICVSFLWKNVTFEKGQQHAQSAEYREAGLHNTEFSSGLRIAKSTLKFRREAPKEQPD